MLLVALSVLTGCKKEDIGEEDINLDEEVNLPIEEVESEPIEIVASKEGIPSPLSGIYAPEEVINRRVVAVMFDNHPSARWQSGLKDAEIVYEFQVEAPYTRYLGLYLINEPESIGSIRSARPYFVETVLEYDAVYVRVGGSEEAKAMIKNLKVADIDSLNSSSQVFWRNNNKKMPHNLYTSIDTIRKTQEDKGYRMLGEYSSFKFNEEDLDILGFDANSIEINYFNNNKTEYVYDMEENIYKRRKDNKDHIDELDNSQLIAKNIIIQEANTKVIDNEGRLKIDVVGEGKGQYFTNGVGKNINWIKKGTGHKTIYYEENGEELILNPGVTWIQVLNPKTEIIIE